MSSKQNIFETGKIFLINKPIGWTSFDVVKRIRSLVKVKRVGHAGTLDPLATGLLIVCTGKFTKRIHEFMSLEKEYSGSLILGSRTPTYDLESEPGNFKSYSHLTEEVIRLTAEQFTGEILQVPPIHSAIKVDGERSYKLARQGSQVDHQPRKIFIREFVISNIEMPSIDFRVVCSTGTYIRSLVNDFGEALGCGAYLSSLCRLRIGEYSIKDSLSIEQATINIREMTDQNG
jgi:tRNA pseudouridine55 synthase